MCREPGKCTFACLAEATGTPVAFGRRLRGAAEADRFLPLCLLCRHTRPPASLRGRFLERIIASATSEVGTDNAPGLVWIRSDWIRQLTNDTMRLCRGLSSLTRRPLNVHSQHEPARIKPQLGTPSVFHVKIVAPFDRWHERNASRNLSNFFDASPASLRRTRRTIPDSRRLRRLVSPVNEAQRRVRGRIVGCWQSKVEGVLGNGRRVGRGHRGQQGIAGQRRRVEYGVGEEERRRIRHS